MTASALGERLDEAAADERRRALRALLRHPLLAAEGPGGEHLAAVRRHRDALAGWCMEELGWRLVVEGDFARLHKVAAPRDPPGRALRTRSGAAFDRRQYALLCLVLACLDRAPGQTTLARIAEDVRLRAGEVAGLDIDFVRCGDRWAFVHAVRAAADLGVLQFCDGDDDRFARGEEGADALYRVRHRRLAQLVSAPRAPSAADRPEDLVDEPYADTPEGAARRSRHRVMRALVEEPVLHFDDLEPAERDYLRGQRSRIERQVTAACGFEFELRAEGVAVVDPEGEATDEELPAEGSEAHAALLLAGELVARARAADAPAAVPMDEVDRIVGRLAETHARWWRAEFATAEGRARLARAAVEVLAGFGLVRLTPDGVAVRPAAARFAVAPAPDARVGEAS